MRRARPHSLEHSSDGRLQYTKVAPPPPPPPGNNATKTSGEEAPGHIPGWEPRHSQPRRMPAAPRGLVCRVVQRHPQRRQLRRGSCSC